MNGLHRWWAMQRTIRCAGHGLRLKFGLPMMRDGIQHGTAGCHPGGIQLGGIYRCDDGDLVAVVEVRGAECVVTPQHAPDGYVESIDANRLARRVGTVGIHGCCCWTEDPR